ncbi:MAG: polysaccharide pyruvyl transferase family protein [Trueperaceae bacterium]|nr:polysaccharide pyruvyl transferase family protein [Trueperaceae bacterium]
MRLLVAGYAGAGNLGDEALLAGLLGALHARGIEAWVASADPPATRAQHGVVAVGRLGGVLGALARVDAVVSGGGGLLQDATSFRSLAFYLGVVAAARAARKPVAVFAQSLGPLSPRGERAVQRVLRGVPLGLRDAPSLDLAARLGLAAHPVADTALLLATPPPAAGGGALVLVPRAGYPYMTDALAALARPWRAGGGAVRVASLDPGRDAGETARLLAAVAGAERWSADRPEVLLAGFAGAHAVLSGRLHGLVLGTVAGVPVAGIAYDPKVAGFAARIGAPVADVPRDAAAVAATVVQLAPFVAAPSRDAAAADRERRAAEAGVAWLLREALHVPSSPRP